MVGTEEDTQEVVEEVHINLLRRWPLWVEELSPVAHAALVVSALLGLQAFPDKMDLLEMTETRGLMATQDRTRRQMPYPQPTTSASHARLHQPVN